MSIQKNIRIRKVDQVWDMTNGGNKQRVKSVSTAWKSKMFEWNIETGKKCLGSAKLKNSVNYGKALETKAARLSILF